MSELKRIVVQEKAYASADWIIMFARELVANKKEYVPGKQILKSGPSIGANVEEALGGISKKDFVAKMVLPYKEAREKRYWLRIPRDTDSLSASEYTLIISDGDQLLELRYSLIHSSRSNTK